MSAHLCCPPTFSPLIGLQNSIIPTGGTLTVAGSLSVTGGASVLGALKVKNFDHNVYVIGGLFDDTGNWANTYGKTGTWTYGPTTPITPPPSTLGSLIHPTIVLVNNLKRYGQGFVGADFVARELELPQYTASTLSSMPTGPALISFAINGSMAKGNVWNGPTDTPYFPLVGPGGYDSQVTQLAVLLNGKQMDPEDVVLYTLVGGSEITRILTSAPADQPNAIADVIIGTMTNLLTLYAMGARRIVFTYTDAATIPLTPSYIKADVYSGSPVIAGSQAIANALFAGSTGLVNLISQAVGSSGAMPLLDVNILATSPLLLRVQAQPDAYGVRTTLVTDLDPRVPPAPAPAFPFPTHWDMYVNRGVNLHSTLYYEDVSLTEIMFQNYAQLYLNTLRNYSPISQKPIA